MRMSGDYSLYIHVPFCNKKCPYCHFYVLKHRCELEELWLKRLLKEWQKVRPPNKNLLTLYLGGGTPSLLKIENLEAILEAVGGSPQEITLEANPEDVTYEKAKAWQKMGINRISMGVQSLIDSELIQLGRSHESSKAVEAVEILNRANLSNISIDLMYDLPNQNANSFKKSLDLLQTLPITHLSLYNLTLEPGTPFGRQEKELKKKTPTDEESRELYKLACQKLEAIGLLRYEISAFCKDNLRSLHNVGYWEGRPFLGLGPSAFSYWEEERYQNIPNLQKYLELEDPIHFREKLPQEAATIERFLIALRLKEGVLLNDFEKNVAPLLNETKELLALFEQRGWIEAATTCPHLTDEGLLFYDEIAAEMVCPP